MTRPVRRCPARCFLWQVEELRRLHFALFGEELRVLHRRVVGEGPRSPLARTECGDGQIHLVARCDARASSSCQNARPSDHDSHYGVFGFRSPAYRRASPHRSGHETRTQFVFVRADPATERASTLAREAEFRCSRCECAGFWASLARASEEHDVQAVRSGFRFNQRLRGAEPDE